MFRRASLIAVSALALTAALTPFAAQARPRSDLAHSELDRVAGQLSDPANQAKASAVAAIFTQMLLDLRVGPLARAMGEMGDGDARYIPEDATLGDLAGPEARDAPRQMAREVPHAMRAMGSMTGAFDAMIPQLQDMAEQMRRTMKRYGRRY